MDVFWRVGYEKTLIEELMREMGVAKQSFYDTFGGKRDLYMKALAYYRDVSNGEMERLLAKIPSVKEGFAKLVYGLAGETPGQYGRGCLLLSANLQRDPSDVVLTDFLRDNQARVKAIFVKALRRAQKLRRTVCCAGPRSARALFRGHDSRDAGDGQAQV
jgi:TetR/AcrR family transcriptional repressor of nem operon